MKNLRNNREKIIILILIFIIILLILLKISVGKDFKYQEDLIFFKLFDVGNMQKEDNEEKIYKIEIKKGGIDYKKINLTQTIDTKTLVHEKIAPGTKGNFFVTLIANEDLEYEIQILEKNKKPKNLKFEIMENKGKLEKGKIKKVEIKWKWDYEINEEENKQDTKDGENIEIHNFEICTIGK